MARGTSGKTHPPLRVRYYKRMKKQQVYTAQVSWSSPPSKAKGTDPYTIRLVMPGAQVVPTERIMDPGKPKEKAVFYVTPLAGKGQLRGERLEVLQNGEKIQELALPAKVSSIKYFWIFLLLTFLVPWFMLHYLRTEDPVKWDSMMQSVDTTLIEETPLGSVSDVENPVEEHVPEDVLTTVKNFFICVHFALTQDKWVVQNEDYRLYLPLWIGVTFFVLALLAWCLGRVKRASRVSKPLTIRE